MMFKSLVSVSTLFSVLLLSAASWAAGSPRDAVIQWQWLENSVMPGATDVMSMPAVGEVTGDRVADVVFVAADIRENTTSLTLVALSGESGRVHWIFDEIEGFDFDANASPVIGDLEGDGTNEICVQAFDDTRSGVICLDGQGNFLDFYDFSVPGNGPSLADLDGDGEAEIIGATAAVNLDGDVVASTDLVPQFGLSFAADITGNGMQEIITERAIFTRSGRVLWQSTSRYGPVGLADVDRDGYPELIQVLPDPAEIRCINVAQNGGMCWSEELREAPELAGPPTIADFDGDGWPEIAVASFDHVYLVDHQGQHVWMVAASDRSSGSAGLSAFDFDGDGDYEIAYADERTFRILDGGSGRTLFEFDQHGSGTWLEYPVIADVDNDGAAEVVLGSNDFFGRGISGITVFEGGDEAWAPARQFWNQHAYTFTNVDEDGAIPRSPTPNWWCTATFRAQAYIEDEVCEEILFDEELEEEALIFKGGGLSCQVATMPASGPLGWILALTLLFSWRRWSGRRAEAGVC